MTTEEIYGYNSGRFTIIVSGHQPLAGFQYEPMKGILTHLSKNKEEDWL